jgi:CDP-diacylglycerol--serine O-phosphatidyltransferase
LARFNTQLESDRPPPWAYNYFVGVPAPAAAGVVLLPMMLTFQMGPGIFDHVALNSLVVVAVSILMVSRVPTHSFKSVRVAPNFVVPVLLAAGLLAAFLVVAPWKTISAFGVLYLLSFPFSVYSYRRRAREAAQQRGTPDSPPDKPDD